MLSTISSPYREKKMHQIKNHRTGGIIFEGDFPSMAKCVEQAVQEGVCMDFADLTHVNLVNASLDEACLRHARLAGANLMGANLSEADLDGADFTNAGLQNACLCFSSLRHCRFEGTGFGATDIAGCAVDRGTFSTLSAFFLNFRDTASMQGCVYADPGPMNCVFSRPPVVITGFPWPIIIMDRHIKIGSWTGRLAPRPGSDENPLPGFLNNEKSWLVPLIERAVTGAGGLRLSA
jgi:hypothetical protein